MDRLDEITLGDLGRTLGRYRPFIAVLTGILLVAVFLPGEQSGTGGNAASQLTNQGTTGQVAGNQGQNQSQTGGPTSTTNDQTGATTGGGTTTSGGNATGGDGGGEASGPAGGEEQAPEGGDQQFQQAAAEGGLNDTCDEAAGHIAIPSLAAPPCVQTGPNTGDDTRGVTGDTIKVVRYLLEDDPTSDAILQAAGVDDSDEEVMQQTEDYLDYYQHHYETYGREIEVIPVKQSGSGESATRSDAVKVAEEIGAFASLNPGGTPTAYTDEVTARGVMCLGCQTSQPIGNYQDNAPYSWGQLMASTEGYVHRAEYVGKRLAGDPAEYAGDATMALEDRKFGLVYYNNGGEYEDGANFFEQHLRDEYGLELAARRDYVGYPETEQSQIAARPIIQAMLDAGVTSILCACDPFAPIFFTQEATRQNYFPEWIITGSALTDTTFFARTYDQQQWSNAFGISFLTARVPEELEEDLRLLKWHFGEDYEPPADGYGVIRTPVHLFMTGVHMAGPTLTPHTFEQGMFSMPPRAQGHIMQQTQSFGQHNWPHNSYTAYDDITELWWDPAAEGEDENGAQGVGMYQYVDMGQRYMPGEQPNGPPKAFEGENTVTVYDDYPPGDEPPQYQHE